MSDTLKKIPCLDLSLQHRQVKNEIFELFEQVYERTAFSGGPFVEQFEKDWLWGKLNEEAIELQGVDSWNAQFMIFLDKRRDPRCL